jgi:glutathione S-transferase
MSQAYLVYGNELSYFTRKLEAALIFYRAPFELRAKDPALAAVVEARSGTHQIPVLHTPENWMIADTTPLLHLLDGRFPFRRLFPPGPSACCVTSSRNISTSGSPVRWSTTAGTTPTARSSRR